MRIWSLLDDDNTKEEQGEWGEFRVKNKILRIKDQLGEMYLYNDMYVKNDNHIFQIDHILVCSKGVFVIETKAIQGTIYPNLNNGRWVAMNYENKTIFNNPIAQNNAHITALKKTLKLDAPCHSIIVFTERNLPEGLPDNIINLRDLQNYLLTFKSEPLLNQEQISDIKTSLEQVKSIRIELKKIHKKNNNYL